MSYCCITVTHFDEDACSKLHVDSEAVKTYDSVFASLYRVTKPGGLVVIADASRRNLWNDLGFRNPLWPTIEWHLHQPPEVWSGIAERHGFEVRPVRWTSLGHLGWVGDILGGNRLLGYCTLSHFSIALHRPAGG